jgi:hypothetical protein
MGTRGSFLGVKQLGQEVIPPLPQYAFMAWYSVKLSGDGIVIDVQAQTDDSEVQ